MNRPSLHVLWMYPDVLHLHGDRGNVMALRHVAGLMGIDAEIRRVDSLQEAPDFAWADLLYFGSGELKRMPVVVSALIAQKEALDRYVAGNGMIVASGSSAAILAQWTKKTDNAKFSGLKLLDITCKQCENVYGDDLWFELPDGGQAIGCQIRVIDIRLSREQAPLGRVLYGYGNNGQDGSEGARSGNLIACNAQGPLLVKNPRLAAAWICDALAAHGVTDVAAPDEADFVWEDASFALIRKFIEDKMAAAGAH